MCHSGLADEVMTVTQPLSHDKSKCTICSVDMVETVKGEEGEEDNGNEEKEGGIRLTQ